MVRASVGRSTFDQENPNFMPFSPGKTSRRGKSTDEDYRIGICTLDVHIGQNKGEAKPGLSCLLGILGNHFLIVLVTCDGV